MQPSFLGRGFLLNKGERVIITLFTPFLYKDGESYNCICGHAHIIYVNGYERKDTAVYFRDGENEIVIPEKNIAGVVSTQKIIKNESIKILEIK